AAPKLGNEQAVEATEAGGAGEGVKRGEELAATKARAEAESRAEARAAAKEEAAEERAEAKKKKEEEVAAEEAEAEEEAEATEVEAAAEENSGALSSLSLGDGASALEELEVPTALLPVYQSCGSRYGISWEVLAAINKVETGFGTDLGTSGAGAEGWMQFLPSSWRQWGVDADGDGDADSDDPVDAICAAARYLAASGGESDIYDAVLAYNHADWYAREVLADARRYERVPANLVDSLTALAEGSTSPVADGEVRAVVDGTVAAAGENEALGSYVVLRDAAGDRIVYSNLGRVTVGAGTSVSAGDALGEVGEAGLGFSVEPDASAAIDPSELLEIWKRGGVGAIYGADAATASAESKSVRALLMSAAALRREVLADPDLEFPACVRKAVDAGELQRQVLAALEYLTGRGYEVGVAASTCERGSGFALEIATVDGESVSAGQGSGSGQPPPGRDRRRDERLDRATAGRLGDRPDRRRNRRHHRRNDRARLPAAAGGADRRRRRGRPDRRPRRGPGDDRRRQSDRRHPVYMGRRPRRLGRGRLRLLGLGQLRPPRRRPAFHRRDLGRARELGRIGRRQLGHRLRQRRTHLRGDRRPALGHGRRRERHRPALAHRGRLPGRLHGPSPDRRLIATGR
ncbi:MAG TPA: lytic murein transglycosylase, partial [Solirubrobacterales bacterium]